MATPNLPCGQNTTKPSKSRKLKLSMQQDIIPRTTLTQLVAAWRQSEQEIRQGFALLDTAQARLNEQFRDTYRFTLKIEHCSRRYTQADEVLKELKKEVWSVFIERMELRRILSVERAKELDRQLQSGAWREWAEQEHARAEKENSSAARHCAATGFAVVKAYDLELQTGRPHCACC